MITLGIDLSSMPEGTAACCIEWRKERVVVRPPLLGCTDDELDSLISKVDVVGVDAPLGWPEAFVYSQHPTFRCATRSFREITAIMGL